MTGEARGAESHIPSTFHSGEISADLLILSKSSWSFVNQIGLPATGSPGREPSNQAYWIPGGEVNSLEESN